MLRWDEAFFHRLWPSCAGKRPRLRVRKAKHLKLAARLERLAPFCWSARIYARVRGGAQGEGARRGVADDGELEFARGHGRRRGQQVFLYNAYDEYLQDPAR